MKKTIKGQVDSKKPLDPFMPTGPIKFKYGDRITEEEVVVNPMKKKSFDAMQRAESKETLTYMKDMETIKKDLNLDDDYFVKFGLLKKASILSLYGRDKDAKKSIADAAVIV